MLQLPMLSMAPQGPAKSAGAPRLDDGSTLRGLLTGADGAAAGLSGELQALLMQLSPQMLQRLDELVAGGMSLPQAASALLEETLGSGGELFADFLKQRIGAAPGNGLPAEAGEGPDRPAGLPGQLFEKLQGNLPVPRDLANAAPAVATLVALQAATQLSGGGQLTPQITSSLLDMGVPQAVGGKGWDAAIADRLMWMVQGDQQVARLKLNPPNLGPLEVRLNMQQDQASVSFIAQHAAVREALEAALPRLREMFDQQSLQLVQADVSERGSQHGDRAQDAASQAARTGHWGPDEDVSPDPAGDTPQVAIGSGLVDLFA